MYICRYIPRGYGTHTFTVPGVTVINGDDVASQCDSKHCPVTLTNMTRLTEGAYKCEVSTEAPKFSLFFETANMSIVGEWVASNMDFLIISLQQNTEK